MMDPAVRKAFAADGEYRLAGVFSQDEQMRILAAVDRAGSDHAGSMRAEGLFAIRQVLSHVPELQNCIWNDNLRGVVRNLVGPGAAVVKSIWFDKPPGGNWFVAYHQDISINVQEKREVPGYDRWTSKRGLIGVVPPFAILERTLTLRIHLDDATPENGALKVVPGSHQQGFVARPAPDAVERECPMRAGDVQLMRPLLLHASMRSKTAAPRRVLHLEVSAEALAGELAWAERHAI